MYRLLLCVLGIVLAATIAAVPSYADEPPAAPVIVSTGPHDQSTEVTITATSAAPFVQFRLFNGSGDYHSREVHSPVIAPNADGKFVATIPARGLNRQHQVYALNCATTESSTCENESMTAFVDHVRPAGLLNTEMQYLHPAHHDAQAVVPDLAGEQVWLAAGSKRVPAVAGAQSLDISTLNDGTYSFGLQRCSELNPEVCDSPHGTTIVVRRSLALTVYGTSEPLLSQNGDGYWEDVTYRVFADRGFPASIRWRITKDGKTALGPVALTPAETETARSGFGLGLIIDPRSVLGQQLPAGDYQFDVEVATTRDGYRWSTRRSRALSVSNARPIRDLQVDRSVIYPRNDVDGFKTTVRLAHRFGPGELKYGGLAYRIVRADGSRLHDGIWLLAPGKPVATWDGLYPGGQYRLAPEGRYRFEVWVPNASGGVDHVRSASFAVSHRKRVLARAFRPMTAQRTLVRKLREQRGRVVRAAEGALHYIGTRGWPSADLRTMHAVQLPADRLPSPLFKIRGTWRYGHESPGVMLVGPKGRRREVSNWEHYDTHQKSFSVPETFVWPDGKLRFILRSDAPGKVRIDQFVLRYWHYRWID